MKIPSSIVFNYFYCTHSVKSKTNTCSTVTLYNLLKIQWPSLEGPQYLSQCSVCIWNTKIPKLDHQETSNLWRESSIYWGVSKAELTHCAIKHEQNQLYASYITISSGRPLIASLFTFLPTTLQEMVQLVLLNRKRLGPSSL